jgi:hypothetical protein
MTNAQLGALLNYGNPDNKLYGNPAPIPPHPWLVPGVESGKQDIVDTIAQTAVDENQKPTTDITINSVSIETYQG